MGHAVDAADVARSMLACDLDDTLTGSRAGLARLRAEFERHPEMRFVIATGRDLASAISELVRWDIPKPAALITDVGTEIHWPESTGVAERSTADATDWIFDTKWAERLDFQWQPECCAEILAACYFLTPQAQARQGRHKVSYTTDVDRRAIHRIHRRLDQAELKAQIVYSHGGLVDVLASRAGKGQAALFAAAALGVPADRVIAAGNAGNDIDLLQRAAAGIAVGNADADVLTLKGSRTLYFAKSDHADGILEGLAHWRRSAVEKPPQNACEQR